MIEIHALLDLSQCPLAELFDGCRWPWQVLGRLGPFLAERVARSQGQRLRGRISPGAHVADDVIIGDRTVVDAGAVVLGPAIIGKDAHVRAGAYIRGNLLAGDACVLGHACEFKNAVLFNGAGVPHLSYVGDSVIGHQAHLGSGVTLSNFKSLRADGQTVQVRWSGGQIDTGLEKFGAVIGDGAEVGCNCVLNPGSVIGRRSVLYPNISWRGVCPPNRLVKLVQSLTVVELR